MPRTQAVWMALFSGALAFGLSAIWHQVRDAPTANAALQERARPVEATWPFRGEYSPEEQVNMAVYERVNRSVVHITTRGLVQDFFFEVPTEGSGSGSVLDSDGHILSNYHVVRDAQDIRVTLFNGQEYAARIVGDDLVNDIAVLRIDAPREELYPVELGSVEGLRVGQKVFALGNPFGWERTMSVGIVSSLNRTLRSQFSQRSMRSMIQIDAALNKGNSGGPLLDSRGRLIGMNTAIASTTGDSAGIGFAIPVSTIRRVVPQLIEYGRVQRPEIGIAMLAQSSRGPVIVQLVPGGAALRAGLQGIQIERRVVRRGGALYEVQRVDRDSGDVILSVDGVEVETADDVLTEIERHAPGDTITLEVLREGRRLRVPVELEQE